jgi:hypothetical protein
MKKLLLLITLLLIPFLGCKKDENPVSPNPPGGSGNTNPTGQPIPTFSETNNGVLVTINYQQNVFGLTVDMAMAFARFGESGVDVGNVSVNGNQVGKVTAGNSTHYIVPNQSTPDLTLDFNGTVHNWTVQGGNGVTGFTASVTSPRSFNVTAPANNATVSKASGFNITWSGGSSSRVMITLVSQSGGGYFVASNLNDTGSYGITPANLSNFSGSALLQVVKYNYVVKESGGKNYIVVSEIVKTLNIYVN